MRSLNLDQLRTLAEVIEQGSFSAAARRLNLTQPAVSLQVRELERRFGVQLIERLGRQTQATIPGRALVEVNKRSGFRLLTKAATERGAISFSRAAPVIGGFVGGAFDAIVCRAVGRTAKQLFRRKLVGHSG